MSVGEVIVSEASAGAATSATWEHSIVAIDILCGVILITPIFRTRDHIVNANADGREALLQRQRRLWGRFQLGLMQYIYFSRVVPRLLALNISFRYVYAASIVEEIGTLVFYVAIGYLFRPEPNNMYLIVKDDDDEEVDDDQRGIPMTNMASVSRRAPIGIHET